MSTACIRESHDCRGDLLPLNVRSVPCRQCQLMMLTPDQTSEFHSRGFIVLKGFMAPEDQAAARIMEVIHG